MARVMLINPYFLDLYNFNNENHNYYPTGLGYIASYLRKYGTHDVQLYDLNVQRHSEDQLANLIRTSRPDIVGISCASPTFPRACSLAGIVKAQSDAIVVMGGAHVSPMPELILRHYSDIIDLVVIGEGEKTMLGIADAVEKKAGYAGIKGVAYVDDEGITRVTPNEFIQDLDAIPFPARDLVPFHLYRGSGLKNACSIITSRGCPINCKYCAARHISGKRYRMHSAEYVLDEIQMLHKDHAIDHVMIMDDSFTVNKKRLETVCRGIIDRNLRILWFCFSDVRAVDRETLQMMKRAGCSWIAYGVESASPRVLEILGKAIDPARSRQAVQMANEVGIYTFAFYLVGIPGETRQEIIQTLRFAEEVGAGTNYYNILTPYPGTVFFEQYMKGREFTDIDWTRFRSNGQESLMTISDLSRDEINELLGRARKYYYPKWQLLRNIKHNIRGPGDFMRYVRRWN